jgi:hypothetical protein
MEVVQIDTFSDTARNELSQESEVPSCRKASSERAEKFTVGAALPFLLY